MNFLSNGIALRAELVVRGHAIDLMESFLDEVKECEEIDNLPLPLTRYKLIYELARANRKFDETYDLIEAVL